MSSLPLKRVPCFSEELSLFSRRLRSSLTKGLSLCFSYHSCFYCNPLPLPICLLIDFLSISFVILLFLCCLPVFPSPSPLLALSTAKPWGRIHSSFPEPLLCVSRGNRGAHWISPCPHEVHNSVEPLPYGPRIHMGPYDVRGVRREVRHRL